MTAPGGGSEERKSRKGDDEAGIVEEIIKSAFDKSLNMQENLHGISRIEEDLDLSASSTFQDQVRSRLGMFTHMFTHNRMFTELTLIGVINYNSMVCTNNP